MEIHVADAVSFAMGFICMNRKIWMCCHKCMYWIDKLTSTNDLRLLLPANAQHSANTYTMAYFSVLQIHRRMIQVRFLWRSVDRNRFCGWKYSCELQIYNHSINYCLLIVENPNVLWETWNYWFVIQMLLIQAEIALK